MIGFFKHCVQFSQNPQKRKGQARENRVSAENLELDVSKEDILDFKCAFLVCDGYLKSFSILHSLKYYFGAQAHDL